MAKSMCKAMAKPKAKAKTTKKQPKGTKSGGLKRGDLAAVSVSGSMSLDDKIQKLRNSVKLNPEAILDDSKLLSKLDRSKIWQTAKTAIKTDKDLAADYAAADSRAAQSKVLLGWKLDPLKGPTYKQISQNVTNLKHVVKEEKWITQKQADKKWSEDERNLVSDPAG